MTKAEIIAEIAEKNKLSKADAERTLNSLIDIAVGTLRREGTDRIYSEPD